MIKTELIKEWEERAAEFRARGVIAELKSLNANGIA
jgi:hypothetical protein